MVSLRFRAKVLVVAVALGATTLVAPSAAARSHSAHAGTGECENDPGVNDTEIRVGAIIPSSGPSATSFAAARDGIEARFAKANAEGEGGDR